MFCYYDDFEFHFVFLLPYEHSQISSSLAYKNILEFYCEKIKEIFNDFLENNFIAKISNYFQNSDNKKTFLKISSIKSNFISKYSFLFIENFMELPSDPLLSKEIFWLILNNILDFFLENFFEADIKLIKLEGENLKDLSFLCPIIPENKPHIFKKEKTECFIEKKKAKINRSVSKEFLLPNSKTMKLNLIEKNNKLFINIIEKN